jgi:VIT1/CCC1 family predicted Fe2+/Mn2+ transporter
VAADTTRSAVLVAGVAGLVAGAMSMAAGEYVSVSSQADIDSADLERERRELASDPELERIELAEIYEGRGLDADLAKQVAQQLMEHDALAAHARDELGLSDARSARPLQAAATSALTFAIGAALPLAVGVLSPTVAIPITVSASTLVFLALLGGLAAKAGGAKVVVGAARVTLLGALAMGATAIIGALFGTVV